MLFSSITFLYAFLPCVLLAYYAVPQRFKNAVLLVASLLFYFFGEPVYVLLLLFSSVSDWLHSLFIQKRRGSRAAKAALISSIAINLAMLGVFKYADFLISSINSLLGVSIPLTRLPLPLGISFFTFQTMSYTIDVYRGRVQAEKSLLSFATFVCLFPQLVAGPIVRYSDIAAGLNGRTHTLEGAALGFRRFAFGLGKKVLLANALGELTQMFRASTEKSVAFYWVYAVAFCLQIYFDFSGYSDMAIGLGRMLGFKFGENFNYPYIARSITEFWRRWHISLSAWFRDYVYIPLGGNRVKKARWVFNLAVVWLLTGMWHGASWNFLLWGGFFGVLLILEKLVWGKLLQKGRVLPHIYVLVLVALSFVIFNADGLGGVRQDFMGLFGVGLPLWSGQTGYCLSGSVVLLAVSALGATPLPRLAYAKLSAGRERLQAVLEPLGVLALLVVCTASLVDGSFNPFLYFRF